VVPAVKSNHVWSISYSLEQCRDERDDGTRIDSYVDPVRAMGEWGGGRAVDTRRRGFVTAAWSVPWQHHG
jgi:hypothetical protein